ncbi:hypothetical protein LCGC14_1459220 [marine sediment metagenome]|uniref:Uncharacterized protein n=1 Tax=marine sediment metagenome TaxID=412755 RepID=A0A0F9MHK3_9ZZZZ
MVLKKIVHCVLVKEIFAPHAKRFGMLVSAMNTMTEMGNMNLKQQYKLSAAIHELLTGVTPEWRWCWIDIISKCWEVWREESMQPSGNFKVMHNAVKLPCIKVKGEWQPIINVCTPDGMAELIKAMNEKNLTFYSVTFIPSQNSYEAIFILEDNGERGSGNASSIPEAVALAAKAALEAMT